MVATAAVQRLRSIAVNDDNVTVVVAMTPLVDGSGGEGHRHCLQWRLMVVAVMAVLIVNCGGS